MPAMTDHPTAVGTVRDNASLVLRAFRGLRYAPDRVADLGAVTSPPYDVVDDEEARRLKAAEPHNVVRLILPRAADRHAADRADRADGGVSSYQHAADLLTAWIATGVLITDATPALYVYEQRTPTALQRGLIGALGLRDPGDHVVLPHENVLPGPVADRLELMRATQANLEPIFLLYDGRGPASQLVDEVADKEPPVVAAHVAGTQQRLWAINDTERLTAIAADLRERQALIADGHHRYATYLRLRDERHRAGHGAGPWDFGLALLVDYAAYPPEMRAMHRAVDGLRLETALRAAAEQFKVRPLAGTLADALAELRRARAGGAPAFVLANGRQQHLLHEPRAEWAATAARPNRAPLVRALDATLMTDGLLGSLWGIGDDEPRVRYEHDPEAAVRRAEQRGGTAVLLTPPTVADVLGVAVAGERMPRKSTSFGPKPCNGLVLRRFEPDAARTPP